MAWRQYGSKKYYYRQKKVGGEVVSQYVGGGPFAELAAQLDEAERIRAKAKRELFRREVAKHQALDDELGKIDEVMRALVDGVMLATGHYTHKRQWKKVGKQNGG